MSRRRATIGAVIALLLGGCNEELPVPVRRHRTPPVVTLTTFEVDELREGAFRVVAQAVASELASERPGATICALTRTDGNPDSFERSSTDRAVTREGAVPFARTAASVGLEYSCEPTLQHDTTSAGARVHVEVLLGPIARWPGDTGVEVSVGVQEWPPGPLGCTFPRERRCTAEQRDGVWRVLECRPRTGGGPVPPG